MEKHGKIRKNTEKYGKSKIKTLLTTHILTTRKTIKNIEKLGESLSKEMNLKNLCDLYWELEILKMLNENTIEVKNNEECIQ